MKLKNLMLYLILFVSFLPLTAQERNKLSVEWIYSYESFMLTRLPRTLWTADDKLLMYESNMVTGLLDIFIYDPETGSKQPLLKTEKVLQNFNKLNLFTDYPFVDWPEQFDKTGSQAVYFSEGDIYLLDIKTSEVKRLTETEEEEKNVNFSPDGNYLAYVRNNNLYVYDIKGDKEKQLTSDGSETLLNGTLSWVYWEEIFGRQDHAYWWSPDSKSIVFLQSDESEVGIMHYLDFEPNIPNLIKQRYPKTGEKNPTVKVGVANVVSDKITWVNLGDAKYEYIVRVDWMNQPNRLAVRTMDRNQYELDLYFVDVAKNKANHILKESDYKGWVNISDDLYFLKDNKHFIWSSERTGYNHLYLYKMDGTLVNPITKGEWAARTAGAVYWLNKSLCGVDEKNETIYFTALEKSSVEMHLYKVEFDGSGFERISEEDGTHSPDFSPSTKYYVNTYSTINTPDSKKLYDADGDLLAVLGEPDIEGIANLDLQYPELFEIPSYDNFLMPARILKPKDFDPDKKYPLIIYVYGGPSAPSVSDSWGFNNYFDNILAQNGYIVASVDNRSATAKSKILENTIYKNAMGENELADLLAAVKWFKDQSYIDADRVGIWGWSGGGTFTLNAMFNSKEFKAGIDVAGVSHWKYYDTKWGEAAMKLPKDNPEGYAKTSLVDKAKNLHGRLMLVHGTYDDNVHPQNAWVVIDELIKANKMFDMMFYPMRQHGIADRPARIHLYNKMLEFWKMHL